MNIFSVFSFAGGIALFLYGMQIMGGAISRQASGRFKPVLENLSANPVKGLLLGTGVTAVIQSSAATLVMVLGFVNSGIMTLENSIGLILGANIGTTATGWILSLNNISETTFFLRLLNPSSFVPILAAIGAYFQLFSKSDAKKNAGQIMLGFSVLMYGMSIMSDAMEPLTGSDEFKNVVTLFSNPLLGVIIGFAITAATQSSSASIGILQAMSVTGGIKFSSALPIVMGINIGACLVVLLSSVGGNRDARRVAVIDISYNILGAVICLLVYTILDAVFVIPNFTVNAVTVAATHSLYKIVIALIFLPLRRQLIWLAKKLVPTGGEEQIQILDERFLATPPLAVARCRELTVDMAELSRKTLYDAVALVGNFNESASRKILEAEAEADEYEDKLGTYMVKLSSRNMSEQDSRELGELLHCIGDLERISDHAENIMQTAEEMYQKDIHFSPAAQDDLRVMRDAVLEIVQMAVDAFITGDIQLAGRVEPLEQVVDMLKIQLKNRHIARLQRSDCTTMLGFVFSDLITNFERVADHCSNIAICVIQKNHSHSFDAHKYLEEIRTMDNEHFEALHNEYLEKYSLSPNI
jgi:phosphate:Na+ symporter